MSRVLIVIVAVALAAGSLAGTAMAQVAAPALNPAALQTTALNPAVLQWSAPSRVSLGYFKGENTVYNAAGTQVQHVNLPGTIVQGRVVGDHVSASAEQLRLKIEPDGAPGWDYRETQLALAGQIGGAVALGAGQDQVVQNPPPAGVDVKDTLALGGLSMRFGERVYLGIVSGKEKHQDPAVPDASRSVMRYGLGYGYHDKMDGFHAEYYHEQREALQIEVVPGVFSTQDEEKWDTGVLEFAVSGFYLGLVERKMSVITTGQPNFDERRHAVNVGWVPDQGFSVVLHVEKRDRTLANGNTADRPRQWITVAYLF
ncbi:MAG TPA: hypothetical protein VKB51_14140 [bacterium]|nr:hypothetical protein [bacterium]